MDVGEKHRKIKNDDRADGRKKGIVTLHFWCGGFVKMDKKSRNEKRLKI